MSKSNKSFVEITNRDIYNEIQGIKSKIGFWSDENTKQHSNIIERLDKTNGKVKLNRWIATTAMLLFTVVLGMLIEFAFRIKF